ncbi:MAG TPA: hypothetical protein VM076_03855 [Gemmatimonadaceae bacterium]|nr:hypothetical protein [Gemmatimonadaceae bacterium]
MPIGLVREVARSRGISVVAGGLGLAFMAAAACSSSSLSGPADASLITNRDGVAIGPSGLEQRLVTKVEAPPAGGTYTAQLTVTSTIVNTGSAPVKLTTRMCLFTDADIETNAQMNRLEPLISCGAVEGTSDLAPGQSTGSMQAQFLVRSGSGTYTIKLRHALSPQFRAEASFRIP